MMAFSKPQTKVDCEFVNELLIDIQTDCPVCLQVLFDPYKVTCCGKSFCQTCIERIKSDQQACPTCREKMFSCFPNEELQNSIHQLLVRCTYKNEGCEWTGELGELDNHLNQCPNPDNQLQGCEFTEINCVYCSKCFKRKDIQSHQNDKCLKRPSTCDYCSDYESEYEDVIKNHWPVCPCYPVECPNKCDESPKREDLDKHVAEECPLTVMNCRFHYVGCETKLPRKDMPSHLQENSAQHLSLVEDGMRSVALLCQTLLSKEEEYRKHCRVPPIDFTMNNYALHRVLKVEWYSPFFYTHPCGYKMCLRVDADGFGPGKGTHLSVQLCMMKGEFDDKLDWVYRGEVEVQAINQDPLYKDLNATALIYNTKESGHSRQRVLHGDRATHSWGTHCSFFFIYNHSKHNVLARYVKNDSICFRIAFARKRTGLKY